MAAVLVNQCIFCKSTTNPFSSVEHIFPESLGNKEKILPKGMVCDVCNNGTLSKLDEELLEFEPIKLLKTIHGVASKSGKVPPANFNNVRIESPTPGHVSIQVNSSKNLEDQSDQGFKLNFRGNRKMDATRNKLLAREFYKIGLELVCLDHGQEFALSERFDDVREIILGKKDFIGYLAIGTNEKSLRSGIYYFPIKDEVTGSEFYIFDFNYMFVRILFDMERRKALPENGSKLEKFTILKFDLKD